MTERVLLGKRGSDYGLFVSKPGEDVTDATDSTNLSFDSRALGSFYVAGEGSPLKGEGSIASSNAYNYDTISHSLGYIPQFAVRWCYASDLSSGVAVRMYNPAEVLCTKITYLPYWQTEQDVAVGGVTATADASNLTIINHFPALEINHSSGSGLSDVNAETIYYAYVIFQIPGTGASL
jgi:hypothetical protein